MSYRRIALSATVCLIITAALFGEEPECAKNYRADGNSSETIVMTSLTPQAVIERLPRMLIAAGVSMQSTEPEKGILTAAGLDVKADAGSNATRVIFRSSAGADKATLCRYASLVGNPAFPPVPQDPTLIAQMKDDLIKLHQITQPSGSGGLNSVTFTSQSDFLELTIRSVKTPAVDRRQYGLSLLVVRAACGIAGEDAADGSLGFGGRDQGPRTKPARVDVSLVYVKDGGAWHLAEAALSHIESVK